MNPNHYLAVAIWFLFQHRSWKETTAVGKTLVSSSMIDRVARHLNRQLVEVPVGFKWFVEGLIEGRFGFGGEESAGRRVVAFSHHLARGMSNASRTHFVRARMSAVALAARGIDNPSFKFRNF